MAAPVIASSNGASTSDHARKGSVTVAPGAYGQMANGNHVPSASRPNISFGSMNTDDSLASTPSQQQNSLPPPVSDPRVRSPAASPSPIPQPATSGGRPQSIHAGNGINFGSVGGPEDVSALSGPSAQGKQLTPHAQRQSPAAPQSQLQGQQQAHLRRASSQSVHSDAGNNGMPMGAGRGGFMPQGGRGRNYSGQGFQQQIPYSPAQQFRPSPANAGRPGSIPPHFQNQMGAQPGSPHMPPRSPALPGSQPGTPHMQQMAMSNSQMGYQYPPPQYQQHMEQQNFAPMQGYQQNMAYYQQPYMGHPNYLNQGAPPSPRHGYQQMPPTQRQSYIQGQFGQHPGAPNMSRTSSQVSDRPASSLSGHQHPATPSHPSHTPSQSQSSIVPPPGGSSNFTIPTKAKKGIVIKNADGEIVTFDKKPSPTPASIKAPSPAPSSSAAPTPPPRSDSTVSNARAPAHVRTESKSGKTAEEIKAQFQEQVKRNAAKEIKEEAEKTPAVAAATADSEKPAAVPAKVDEEQQSTAAVADKSVESQAEVSKETKAEAKPEPEPEKVEAPTAIPTINGDVKQEETEEEKKKREEEEFERMIAEMEAEDARREEEQRLISERKAAEKAEKAAKEKAALENADEEMKRLEREAEAAEEARENERDGAPKEQTEEEKAEAAKLFASLKKPTLGPGAEGADAPSEDSMLPPPVPSKSPAGAKPKPAALKLETAKSVEPAQPTPGMRSLRSARLLQLQNEEVKYPEGIQSPNPALNQGTRRSGKVYDTAFLLQFKDAFKEKPSLEWEDKLKSIVGDQDGSKSARTPSSRQASHRGPPTGGATGTMGSFSSGARTLPSGTTSEQRFQASQSSGGRPASAQNPLAAMGNLRAGSGFPMGAGMGMGGRGSMPAQSGRGGRGGSRNDSRRGDRVQSRKEQENLARTMPLTANMELKPIEVSATGWKPMSKVQSSGPDPSGHMAPDMVQRKVKSNLNKMTPENFDKIADQILLIASQSKNEQDGRTLRQVIQLTFEKACDEAHWASMYARFCKLMLEQMSPDIKDENVKDKAGNPVVGGPLFRKYLLNRCQDEFEKGWQVNLPEKEEGQTEEAVMLSDEYYIAAAAKRKGLGLIQFIGELYKLGMLSIRIMHECVCKLLDFEGPPDETAIESLVKLLRTVGGTMAASEQGPQLIGPYFERIQKIMATPNLPSRMHFMLLDTVELKKSGWNSKDDAKGPKTIQEIRDEALAAQQKAEMEKARRPQGGPRMPQGRGDARNFSGPPPDYNRNVIGTDDLRKLQKNITSRGTGGPSRGLGPTSMFASRSNSGRPGLGPGMAGSGSSSRTGSRKAEEKPEEEKSSANAFR